MILRYTFKDPQPFSHQKRALAKVAKLDGKAALLMPMRTGKSRVAIDWAGIAYHNMGLRRVLVVCPRTVMPVWEQQIAAWSPVPATVVQLTGATTKRVEVMQALRDVPVTDTDGITWVIVNYDALWRSAKGAGPRGGAIKLEDALRAWAPDLVVADECHRIKNHSSRQSQVLGRLGASTPMRLGLTGTPIGKWPLDLYGQMRFIEPSVWPMNWTTFRHRYGEWGSSMYANVEQLIRYQRLDELTSLVREHSFRIKLEDCFDLPPKTITDLPVTLSPNAKRLYRTMAKEMIVELESGAVSEAGIVLTKMMRLSQITSGFLVDTEGNLVEVDTAKADTAMDLITDIIEQGEKVVVFTRFKHDYRTLSSRLTAAGIGHLMLSGDHPDPGGISVKQFQTDPAFPVFLAQTQSGSLGIDLSAARIAIFYSWDYDYLTYAQAVERIYQAGKTHGLGIYHLVVPHTIDSLSLSILRAKGALAHAVIHDPQSLLGGD